MAKSNRTISMPLVDDSLIGVIASYCHLLKAKLNDNWSINRANSYSDVVIIKEGEAPELDKHTKVKIVLKKHQKDDMIITENGITTYNVSSPLNSRKILEVLNAISKSQILKDSGISNWKLSFKLKNVFSRFMHGEKEDKNSSLRSKASRQQTQPANKVAKALMKMRNHQALNSLKVVLLGRPGSGKTTAISSVCGDSILTSEVNATDTVGLIKQNTTIGIDFGELQFNNTKLRIYGTPGQKRYDFVQNQTVGGADIYIILVDLSSVAPFSEFLHYKDIIEQAGNHQALKVVAFTHYDIKEHNMGQLSKEIRRKCNDECLTVKIDTRQKDEVMFMLQKITDMVLDEVPSHQHYAENRLFLKNINS